MRMMILLFSLVSFLGVSGQTKTPVHVADSVMTYPDTLIIKVPAVLAPTFIAQLNGSDDQVIVAYLKELLRVVGPQIKRQYIKKPKK